LHFRNLRDQILLRDIPDIRSVFSATGTRPADSPLFVLDGERYAYRTIWPIYCPQIGAAATAKRRPVRTALAFDMI
jgi:hypothetical protein